MLYYSDFLQKEDYGQNHPNHSIEPGDAMRQQSVNDLIDAIILEIRNQNSISACHNHFGAIHPGPEVASHHISLM